MAASLQQYVPFKFDSIRVTGDLVNYQATFGNHGISIVEHKRSGKYNVVDLHYNQLYDGYDPVAAARVATLELSRA